MQIRVYCFIFIFIKHKNKTSLVFLIVLSRTTQLYKKIDEIYHTREYLYADKSLLFYFYVYQT